MQTDKKALIVVEHHHHVLPAWAELRRGRERPPHLLTFDFHTDTLKAFNVFAYKTLRLQFGREPTRQEHESECARLAADIDFNAPVSIEAALKHLRHDEHIDAARRAGIIDRVFIVLSTRAPGNVPPFGELFLPKDAADAAQAASVIESETLAPVAAALGDGDYIADIDLDFFRSAPAIAPRDAKTFRSFLQNAALVTVARESKCVEQGRLAGESITADSLLEKMTLHFRAEESG